VRAVLILNERHVIGRGFPRERLEGSRGGFARTSQCADANATAHTTPRHETRRRHRRARAPQPNTDTARA
jgi:hypothetical protein